MEGDEGGAAFGVDTSLSTANKELHRSNLDFISYDVFIRSKTTVVAASLVHPFASN